MYIDMLQSKQNEIIEDAKLFTKNKDDHQDTNNHNNNNQEHQPFTIASPATDNEHHARGLGSTSSTSEADDNILIIDSIDGVEHHRSKKSITTIVSYSVNMVTPTLINAKVTTAGSSLNILTFQQMVGKESPSTVLPSVASYLKEKQELEKKSKELVVTEEDVEEQAATTDVEAEVAASTSTPKKYWFYNTHDVKMLYLLCQHSQWNRKEQPYLLCACKRGEGVLKPDTHSCSLRSHSDEIRLWKKSEKKWEHKRSKKGDNYTKKLHADWCDEKNKGVSHFGLHPDLLPRDGIRFDTFHLKCAITRRMMDSLRALVLNQSDEVQKKFKSDVLSSFWNEFHLFVWKSGKKFSSFQGNELALFVANTKYICTFLRTSLVLTNDVQSIITGLELWEKMFDFLGKSRIEEGTDYLKLVEEYEKNSKNFYEAGKSTYLSQSETDGKGETCYMHVMRYYIPSHARTTYTRHNLGIGIFNMQGFERRNKESKNVYRRFSNKQQRGRLTTTLGRLWEVWKFNKNAY